jgi:hypothetical protein
MELFPDEDGDGYGSLGGSIFSCQDREGYASNGDDCSDRDPSVNPGVDEVCEDGVDNNCDGSRWCELDEGRVLLTGHRADDHAGVALDGGQDLNGDGYDDLVVGASENDGNSELNTTNRGATYVLYGPITGLSELALIEADVRLLGVELGRAGSSLAGVGDVDGGGLPDFLIGAPGPGVIADEARVHLVLGEELGQQEDLSQHRTWTALTAVVAGAGGSVGGGGHMDSDGLPELLIGSEPSLAETGVAWLIWGADIDQVGSLNEVGVQFRSGSTGDKAGTVVQDLGDVDGDGLAEFAIGAARWGEGESGAVYVVSSMDIGDFGPGDVFSLDDAILIRGTEAGSRWGGAIASGVDLTNDGLNDLIVGAAGYESENGELVGAAKLIVGSPGGRGPDVTETLLTGLDEGQSFGAALDIDDFDGDGEFDVIVGAPARGSNTVPGGVFVYLGPIAGLGHLNADMADWKFADSAAASEAGAVVDVAHGITGQGAEIFLGLPRWSVTGSDLGAAMLLPY